MHTVTMDWVHSCIGKTILQNCGNKNLVPIRCSSGFKKVDEGLQGFCCNHLPPPFALHTRTRAHACAQMHTQARAHTHTHTHTHTRVLGGAQKFGSWAFVSSYVGMVLSKYHQTESDFLGFFPTLPEANSFFIPGFHLEGKNNRSDGLMAVTSRSHILHTWEIMLVPITLRDRISFWIGWYSIYEKNFCSIKQKPNLKVLIFTSCCWR